MHQRGCHSYKTILHFILAEHEEFFFFFFDQKACKNISQWGVVDCRGLVLFAWESTSFIYHSSMNLFLVSPEESVEDFLYNLIMMIDVRIFFFLPQRTRFDVVQRIYVCIYKKPHIR